MVERFARNLDVHRRPEYKETQVRVEFIDPLFEALGWDVRNMRGYSEQYKDVVHEDAIKVGGATRAPDYCFRVGGTRKFFLEAKKPSVSVRGDVGPAYQLRRYAWSAKLPQRCLAPSGCKAPDLTTGAFIMPSPRPDYVPGGYYHFYNRGAHRVSIFREAENYVYLLRKMKSYVRELSLAPVAYCLLPNHYHFLLRQNGDMSAGLLPQRVFNGYGKAYNKRYGHSGTLFEGVYKVRPVLDEGHLLHLCRYIHANPVIHGIADHVADWPYSNYLEWVGEQPGMLVDREFIAAHFPNADAYRTFVADYIATRRLPRNLDYLKDW